MGRAEDAGANSSPISMGGMEAHRDLEASQTRPGQNNGNKGHVKNSLLYGIRQHRAAGHLSSQDGSRRGNVADGFQASG